MPKLCDKVHLNQVKIRFTIVKKVVNSSLFHVRLAFHFPPNESYHCMALDFTFFTGTGFTQGDIFKVFVS